MHDFWAAKKNAVISYSTSSSADKLSVVVTGSLVVDGEVIDDAVVISLLFESIIQKPRWDKFRRKKFQS